MKKILLAVLLLTFSIPVEFGFSKDVPEVYKGTFQIGWCTEKECSISLNDPEKLGEDELFIKMPLKEIGFKIVKEKDSTVYDHVSSFFDISKPKKGDTIYFKTIRNNIFVRSLSLEEKGWAISTIPIK